MRFLAFALLLLVPHFASASWKDSTVSITTPTGKIFGTLTMPARKAEVAARVPVAIIIPGSGATDRDGNQGKLKNNSLLALGDSLAKSGIASLRYDKRGIGESKSVAPDESRLRFDDYTSDVVAWVKKLRDDKRFSKVYIIGHSEGSLIGMLAVQKMPVAGFISIAGAAIPADSLIIRQISSRPIPRSLVDSVSMYFGVLRTGASIDSVPTPFLKSLFRPSVLPYFRSWIKYNPVAEMAKVKVPVLIIQGTTDIQVDTPQAYALKAANPAAKLVIIPNMNHVMKAMPSLDFADNQLSYVDPGFLLSKELTPAIRKFIFGIERKVK